MFRNLSIFVLQKCLTSLSRQILTLNFAKFKNNFVKFHAMQISKVIVSNTQIKHKNYEKLTGMVLVYFLN